MSRYNHAIDLAFEFLTEDEEPVIPKNLEALVRAAKARLDRILETKDYQAFGVYDTIEE